jgi:hypothetical protein
MGVFISIQPRFPIILPGTKGILFIITYFALPFLFFFILGGYHILKFYQHRKDIKREKDALFKSGDDEIRDLVRNKRMTVSVPEEISNQCQKLGLQGKSLNDFFIKALEKEIQQRQDLTEHERIVDVNQLQLNPQPDAADLSHKLRQVEGRGA